MSRISKEGIPVREVIDLQKQLIPDLLEVMKKRYRILQVISLSGPLGRRSLSAALDLTERTLRTEVKFLQDLGLLEIDLHGMKLTASGRGLLIQLESIMKDALGLSDLEGKICAKFRLKKVIIVRGNADNSTHTKKELGRAGADIIRNYINSESVVAVTGGSTMLEVANVLHSSSPLKGSWFLPARGGLGERAELQANHIASTMATRVGGQYRLLHIPDQISDELSQSLEQDSQIKEVIEAVRNAKIVIHGIGDAMRMAQRRKVDDHTQSWLLSQGALAEAFGYYFNQEGQVVHKTPTLGLRVEDLQKMDVVIGIAGGSSKGQAIAAFLKHGEEDILISDEAAAQEILKYV